MKRFARAALSGLKAGYRNAGLSDQAGAGFKAVYHVGRIAGTTPGRVGLGIAALTVAANALPKGNDGEQKQAPVTPGLNDPIVAMGLDPATDPAVASQLAVESFVHPYVKMPSEKDFEYEQRRLERQQYFNSIYVNALKQAEENRKIIESLQAGLNPGIGTGGGGSR